MPDILSIRSYSTKPVDHSHDYYQLVLPLRGSIAIKVGNFNGKVAVGECVIVRKHENHLFTAPPEARFVVADMSCLPVKIDSFDGVVFAINKTLSCYLLFIEEQLQQQLNLQLEQSMFHTFYLLLSEQTLMPKLDARIANAIHFIQMHVQQVLSIEQLAQVACLSSTQFKVLFKKYTGMTVMNFVSKVRMEKAQALLRHTDYPINIIGEKVGYPEQAAFSRKFSKHFGLPPTRFKS
ncbi:AraC family transcriptional regulator [Rheinheimera sp. UJ63]|uniref:AraC family transcriptional regulator n=1 Tax=Rheinheimera sp. UJ63 TaxID=2910157 RepID=UPI001F18230C|nr:AraC family transcriptional regulator [Rheinheimera sp. UJ63]MCF4008599.1 AraC family transcriptional regulator [Rheinheimera sp. UJ63]